MSPSPSLTVALIRAVFPTPTERDQLDTLLQEAKGRGAELAVLPELALDPWYPASRTCSPESAEDPGGPRHQYLSVAAQRHGLGLIGGAIVRTFSGGRLNRALAFNRQGKLVATYDKLHLPAEEGFWEGDHYQAASDPPQPFAGLGLPLGIQLCSDINRPTGAYLLAAQGALAVLVPRATEAATYDRWLLVLRATAMTAALYVASVNRPGWELGIEFGGPSVVISPDGEVLAESTEPITVAQIDPNAVLAARQRYPGYLAVRDSVYAAGWAQVR